MIPIAPADAAAATDREVRTGTRGGAPTRTTVVRRRFPTDVADLWEAVTDPDRLPRWFLPVTGDLQVGGRYQLEGNAGGTIEACDPPHGYEATWEYGDQVSWVRVRLSATGDGRTELELAHEAPDEDRTFWEEYGPGAAGIGWDLGLLGLALHIEGGGAAVDPETALAWPQTDEGVAFVRAAASRWADAAITDGDDETAARAAAERTVTFYTVPLA